jgi:hypothetical protein
MVVNSLFGGPGVAKAPSNLYQSQTGGPGAPSQAGGGLQVIDLRGLALQPYTGAGGPGFEIKETTGPPPPGGEQGGGAGGAGAGGEAGGEAGGAAGGAAGGGEAAGGNVQYIDLPFIGRVGIIGQEPGGQVGQVQGGVIRFTFPPGIVLFDVIFFPVIPLLPVVPTLII